MILFCLWRMSRPLLALLLGMAMPGMWAADAPAPGSEGTALDTTGLCIKGTSIGTFVFLTPNRSSILLVGSKSLIEWKYTPLVSRPPATVDIKVQPIGEGIVERWENTVLRAVPLTQNATRIEWTVANLNDGQYKLRLVPEGKETFGVALDKMPCFANGQAIPGNSAAFKVVNPVMLTSAPDPLPPNTSSAGAVACMTWQRASWSMAGLALAMVAWR